MASISALGIGSGLDLNGLLDQLATAERQKLNPIARQRQSYEAKISAFGKLESALSQFQEAAAKLKEPEQFRTVTQRLTGDALTASSQDGAALGTYQIEVHHLAQGYSIATAGVADEKSALGGGNVSFTLGNGDTFTIDIDADDSSLEDIRDAINDAGKGVQASLVNDGGDTPWRLVLASENTGEQAAVADIQFSGELGASLSLDASTEVQARNASMTINGISIQSQGNVVEEAIEGVALTLSEAGSATLEISRNNSAVEKAVKDFVNAYNALQKGMTSLTRFDASTGDAGELLGNSTLRTVQSQLRAVLSAGVEEGDLTLLSDVGISLQLDGTLKINEDDLKDVVSDNLSGLSRLFAGAGKQDGLADTLHDTIEDMLRDNGLIDTATTGLDSSIAGLERQYQRTEERIDATIARYRTQFARLDSMVAQMNSVSSYLTQQFDMMNAQIGRK